MSVQGWRYYNHAAIPTSAPHEEPNLNPLRDETIWHMKEKPLLARALDAIVPGIRFKAQAGKLI